MKKFIYSFITILLIFSNLPTGRAATLPETIQQIKTSVAAVGTFNYKRQPRTLFFGSGVLISPDGLVITANHVIDAIAQNGETDNLRVFLYQDDKKHGYPAKLIKQDALYDLALLHIEGNNFPYLKRGDSSKVKEGDEVAFCGYPYGMLLDMHPTTHRGIVSSISPNILPVISTKDLSPAIRKALVTKYDIFHLDAVVYPGHSGGPLFNPITGELLGIMVCGLFKENDDDSKFKLPLGISYAIPIEHLDKVLE